MNLLQIPIHKKKLDAYPRQILVFCSQIQFPVGRNIVLKLNFNTLDFLLHIYLKFLGDERIRMFRY